MRNWGTDSYLHCSHCGADWYSVAARRLYEQGKAFCLRCDSSLELIEHTQSPSVEEDERH